MKTLKRITLNTVFLSAYAVLFYAWQYRGIAGAGNALVTFLWIMSVLAILTSFYVKNLPIEDLRRTPFETAIKFVIAMAVFFALAWVGHSALAATYFIANLVLYVASTSAVKKADKQEQATA